MKLLPTPLVLLCAWAVLSMARAETVITLPEGDTEHFSVQNAYLFPLLHVDAAAVRTGTNVAFGSMGSVLPVVVSSQTGARVLSDPIRGSLVVGSNRIANAQATAERDAGAPGCGLAPAPASGSSNQQVMASPPKPMTLPP